MFTLDLQTSSCRAALVLPLSTAVTISPWGLLVLERVIVRVRTAVCQLRPASSTFLTHVVIERQASSRGNNLLWGKTPTDCNTFSGLWSHFQVSNLHVHIWILSYPTCGSDLRVEELRRNTNVHAGVNRESLFVIFIGVTYCFPSDECLLLSGYKTFRVDVEGAPFCFSAKSVCQTTFHLFILFLSKKQQKHKMHHFWFDTWCLDQTFFLIKLNYFFKCNNYFEIRHLATFWIHIGKHNLDQHCVLRRCSFFLCCRLSTDFGRIIAESIWEAEDSHLWSDKQIQIFILL